MRIVIVVLVAMLPVWAAAQDRCHGQTPCRLGDRGYHVLLPDGWDGRTPMPVLLHFHGWKRDGSLVVQHQRIADATRARGVILIAPNGRNRSWDFWDSGTEDVGFAVRVLQDAGRKWPLDLTRLYVSGYSFGGAMAWRFACAEGDRVAALLAISGTLGNRAERCAAGPVEVRHVHGLRDTVMRYPFGPKGEITWPVRLWRGTNGCGGAPDRIESWAVTDHDRFERHAWETCASGKPVTLDIHPRGHLIPRGWIARQLDELLERPHS